MEFPTSNPGEKFRYIFWPGVRSWVFPYFLKGGCELAWIWGEDQRNPLKVQDVQFWYTVAQRPFNIYFLTQVEKEKD